MFVELRSVEAANDGPYGGDRGGDFLDDGGRTLMDGVYVLRVVTNDVVWDIEWFVIVVVVVGVVVVVVVEVREWGGCVWVGGCCGGYAVE